MELNLENYWRGVVLLDTEFGFNFQTISMEHLQNKYGELND